MTAKRKLVAAGFFAASAATVIGACTLLRDAELTRALGTATILWALGCICILPAVFGKDVGR